MKLKCHILEVKTDGERLEIKAQGCGDADARWRPMNVITFQCADITSARRAFYVGRHISVEIKAT